MQATAKTFIHASQKFPVCCNCIEFSTDYMANSYNVGLDAGTVTGSTVASRLMAGTGTGSAQSIPVYGQVSAQSTPKPDTYQTTVTATVCF